MNTNDPIKTSQVLPGIWYATFGDFDLGDAIGTGSTEAEAVHDLYQWGEVEKPVSIFLGNDADGMARYLTSTI